MTINPNNYQGISATIVGYAGTDAGFPNYDKSGEKGRSQFRLPVDHGYKDKKNNDEWKKTGTTWITVTGLTSDIGDIRKGDKVRVDDAKFESREYTRKDGTTGQEFETSFGTVTVLEAKDGGNAPVEDDNDQPF